MLGGFDTLYNHEWDARLPARPDAARELRLHALRSALYALLFGGLAWFAWQGWFAWLLVALVAAEYLVTLVDSVVEDDTRQVSGIERVNHMILGFTTGTWFALVGWHALTDWRLAPTALVPSPHGSLTAVLSAFAAGVAISALRDALAARSLARGRRHPPTTAAGAR